MSDNPFADDSTDDGIISDSGSSSSGGSYTPTVADVPEGVAQLVIDAIEHKGGANQCVELPAFPADAPDLSEDYQDHYDLSDAETMSVADIFGFDWDGVDFVGTIPLAKSEDLSDEELDTLTAEEKLKSDGDLKAYVPDPEYAQSFRDANVNDSVITAISKGLNGHHSDTIAEAFGEDTYISVGVGKDRNHGGDKVESRQYVSFLVSDSTNAAFNRQKAAKDAGEISEEEFRDWAAANGFEDKLD